MSNLKKIKVVKLADFFGVVILLPNGNMLDITRRGDDVDCDHRDSIQGDSFGCVSVNKGLIPAGIKTYTVWSREHVANQGGTANTYDELAEYENITGYSYSSTVTTDDIESFVTAVGNAFNGEMLYHYTPNA